MHFSRKNDVNWEAFLAGQMASTDISSSISSQTRALVASNENLSNAVASMASNVSTGLDKLDASFNWGFSQFIAQMGSLSDSLEELIALARNPSQTWAYEQFNIARDAFRKDLSEDALEYLNSAIFGNGGNTGYKLDHRFHMLVGLIRLGNTESSNKEIIDLEKAELAFLQAAKYAKADYPNEASNAMLSASWASYCAGDLEKAKAHALESISLDSEVPESHYQISKIHMNLAQPSEAIPFLEKAIDIDRNYAIKALDDDDFLDQPDALDELFAKLLEREKLLFEKSLDRIEKRIKEASNLVDDTYPGELDLRKVRALREKAETQAKDNSFFGYSSANQTLTDCSLLFNKVIENYVDKEMDNAKLKESLSGISSDEIKKKIEFTKSLTIVGLVLSIFSMPVIIWQFLRPVLGRQDSYGLYRYSDFDVVMLLVLPLAGTIATVIFIGWPLRRKLTRRLKEKYESQKIMQQNKTKDLAVKLHKLKKI